MTEIACARHVVHLHDTDCKVVSKKIWTKQVADSTHELYPLTATDKYNVLSHMPVFLHTLLVNCQADLESLPIFMSKYEMTVLSWNYVQLYTLACT
jgi:hypothetical protein